jgi:hypothetical protein
LSQRSIGETVNSQRDGGARGHGSAATSSVGLLVQFSVENTRLVDVNVVAGDGELVLATLAATDGGTFRLVGPRADVHALVNELDRRLAALGQGEGSDRSIESDEEVSR